ncbi:hypothetical protein LTS15_010366 [Exophiala xenobiotica]|nr:hypothetical protein LTS15_010366 [Exophiala xenobiotica]
MALFCSDQILEGQYRKNIPRLFLSTGQESSVRCILRTGAAARASQPRERVPLPTDADGEEIQCSSLELAKLSATTPFDSGYMSEEGFEHCQSVAGTRMMRLKSAEDLERFLSRKQVCMEFHLNQSYSHGPLLITRDIFEGLCERIGAFPRIKDLVLYMGGRRCEVEVAPPRVQFNACPKTVEGFSSSGYGSKSEFLADAADHLAEIAYCLRYIEMNGRKDAPSPWSLRQFAVYQRADLTTPASCSIFVSLPAAAQEIVGKYRILDGNPKICDMLCVHQSLVYWAVTHWRPYLVHLAQDLDEHTARLLFAVHGEEGTAGLADFGVRQQLKQLEDNILDMILALKASRSSAEDISVSFASIITHTSFVCDDHRGHAEWNKSMALSISKELDLLLERAENLHQKLRSSVSLLSSFLDLESGYTLQTLSRAAQEENKKMEKIATRSMQDAAAVKLLTIIMLIYLPITIVLNFFSTEFITKRQLSNGSTTTSVDHGWTIMLTISVPLTVGTLGIWWLWTQLQFGLLKELCARLCSRQRRKQDLVNPTELC